MLLYDHVMGEASRFRQRMPKDAWEFRNKDRYRYLQHSTVYDLTNVVPLFSTWHAEKVKPVPRRPPVDNLWAEWDVTFTDEVGIRWDWRVGVVLWRHDLLTPEEYPQMGGTLLPAAEAVLKRAELIYGTQMFRRLKGPPRGWEKTAHATEPDFPELTRTAASMTFLDGHRNLWCLWDDSRQIESLAIQYQDDTPGRLHILHHSLSREHFGLPVISRSLLWERLQPHFHPWPVFMSFALLHCKNVVTEEAVPDEGLQRRVAKQGLPRRATAKVLRVVVPRVVRTASGSDTAEPASRQRWHLHPGYFRELRSDFFKSRRGEWIWVQSHFKGDPRLGVVPSRPRVLESGGGLAAGEAAG